MNVSRSTVCRASMRSIANMIACSHPDGESLKRFSSPVPMRYRLSKIKLCGSCCARLLSRNNSSTAGARFCVTAIQRLTVRRLLLPYMSNNPANVAFQSPP